MSKLKEEELLEWFKKEGSRYAFLQATHPHLGYIPTERDKQAYKQIVALIKKPRVTEEWIEEKATEIYNLSYYKSFKPRQIADCIRSLVEEIVGK